MCVGLVLTGRNAPVPGVEGIRGPTINTVPFRVALDSANTTTDALLSRVQSQMVDMIPHQFRSLSKLRKTFPNGHRDFGSLLTVWTRDSVVQEEEGTDFSFSAASWDKEQLQDAASMFGEPYPLVLEAANDGSGDIVISAQYDPRILTQNQLRLVLGQYEVAIRLLASGVSTRLSDVSLLSEFDSQRLVEWAGEPVVTASDVCCCVHETIQRVVAACPGRQAVEGFGESLTYEQLERGANVLARHLLTLDKNIGPGSIIPLWMETCPSAIVALLAVLKLGASYVPLDFRLPIARAQHIVQDVAASLILVSTTKRQPAGQLTRERLVVVEFNRSVMEGLEASEPHPPRNILGPRNPAHLSDLAYVIYTSGSTGKPKGVMMEHRALAATIRDQAAFYGVVPGTRVLALSNLCWDPSLFEIFGALCHGACVCIPTENERGHNLVGAINRFRVNLISTSPAVASLIDLPQTPSVTTMILGGDRIRDDNIRNAHAAGVRLFNAYGPTEACIDAIVHPNVVPGVSLQNLGHPLSSQVWLVDPVNPRVLVPPGCVGEIALSGTLARGYLNDPEKTARSFLTDCPFASPIYLTGDLGRHDVADGSVHFLGRKDRQVKLNGQRVELGDIESAIQAASPDKGPVVVDYFAAGARRLLVAYFFARGGGGSRLSGPVGVVSQLRPDTHEYKGLQAQLRGMLPAYMVPSTIVTASYMPLLSADKVDLDALRGAYERWSAAAAKHGESGNGHAVAVQLTPSETRLKSMWASAIGCRADSIQAHDGFFDLGADSLTAIKLAMLAAKRGTPIPVASIYDSPALRDMAKLLPAKDNNLNLSWNSDANITPPRLSLLPDQTRERVEQGLGHAADDDNVADMFPCTPFQTTSIIQGSKRHKTHYAWFLLQVNGPFDDERLRKACELLCERHGVLRTSFRMVDGDLVQAVYRCPPVDLLRLEPCDSPDNFCSLISHDVTCPVSLGQVMTRFRVAAYTGHGTLLAVGMSHAQYDGFCLNTILNNLHYAYALRKLPDNEASKPSFSRFVRHMLKMSSDSNTASFWADLLRGSSMTMIMPRPAPLDGRQAMSVPAYRAGPCDTTFAMVAKAAWALVLSWLTGTNDVVFGGLVSGRDPQVDGIDEMVGACLNTVPNRVQLPSRCTVADLLRQVKQQQIAATPFETTPFSAVCRYASWPSTTRFGSILHHQNVAQNVIQPLLSHSSNNTAWSYVGAATYPSFCDYVDCWMTTVPGPRETLVSFRYNRSAIPDDRAASINRLFCDVIAAIYDDPSRQVSGLQPGDFASIRVVPTHAASHPAEVPPLQDPAAPCNNSLALDDHGQRALSVLTRLWAEALQLPEDSIGSDVDASFFALGGDSTLAMRLAAACERERLPLDVQDVFDLTTRRLQALRIAARVRGEPERVPGTDPLALVWER